MPNPEPRFAEVPKRRVGTVDFSVLPLDAAIALISALGRQRPEHGHAVHFANAYNIALAEKDPQYRQLLQEGDLVFTDGTPVVWAGRRLHPAQASTWQRVYGPDVMTGVLQASTADGPRHYLLGGSDETLTKLQEQITHRWPAAQVVGAESPPFRAATTDEFAARDTRIRESGATLVWVGLGTPKQDVEVRRLADSLPVTALAVGAAFDFIAGTVQQAPRWMQRSGTEWAFRLAKEPRRLAKRYLWGNPMFIASAVRHSRDDRA